MNQANETNNDVAGPSAPIAEPTREPAPEESDVQANEDKPGDGADRLVPVSEAIRYRKRAQAAEQQVSKLDQHLSELREQLSEARDTITSLDRRQAIDQHLAQADTIDIEAARLLTEIAVEQMADPDVAQAVAELRRNKPYLFRRQDGPATPMPARGDVVQTQADHAAQEAAVTGDRRDLLRYLRLRRSSEAS